MEFSGQYLTYREYKGLGGTLDLMPFNLLEFEARRKIDSNTNNRLVGSNKIPQEVKICEYKLINSVDNYIKSQYEISSNGNVANESIDGYSVSYITADRIGEVIKSKNQEIDDIIRTYLYGVIYNNEHLIYIGVE